MGDKNSGLHMECAPLGHAVTFPFALLAGMDGGVATFAADAVASFMALGSTYVQEDPKYRVANLPAMIRSSSLTNSFLMMLFGRVFLGYGWPQLIGCVAKNIVFFYLSEALFGEMADQEVRRLNPKAYEVKEEEEEEEVEEAEEEGPEEFTPAYQWF